MCVCLVVCLAVCCLCVSFQIVWQDIIWPVAFWFQLRRFVLAMQRASDSCTPPRKRLRGSCSTPPLSGGYIPSHLVEQLFETLWGSDDNDDDEKLTKATPEKATLEKVNTEGSAASQNTDPSSSTVIFEDFLSKILTGRQTQKTEKDKLNDTQEKN